MFNVTIRQVGIEEREEIIICCHEISDEVMSLAISSKGQKSFLLASKDGEMFKLDTKEIFYIESVDNKTFIYCKNNVYETKQKLYELEEILKGTKFFRCSKSMILNIGKIRSVSPSVNSRFEAKLVNGCNAFCCKPCKFNCVNRILSPLFSVGCNGNRCGNFNSDSAFLL